MTRAVANVGDDLIHARARRIVSDVAPAAEVVVAKAHEPLARSLNDAQMRHLKAIIVPGGPGARANLDATYPFLPEAVSRGIPVYFLGVGSRYFPGTLEAAEHALDATSRARLLTLARNAPIGVRDYHSVRVLQSQGVPVQLNGCPAWYSLRHLDQRPPLPKSFARVVFTTPGDLRFLEQSLAVMRHLRSLLPSAQVIVGFHHGIEVSDVKMAQANARIVEQARQLRFECLDVSCSHEKLAAYDDCDLHLGYRVHAHIYFSSLRKPTMLLAEDSRGSGVLHALGGTGFHAWHPFAEHPMLRRALVLKRGPAGLVAPDARIATWLEVALARELELGFPSVASAAAAIDHAYRTRMRPFVERIFAP
ncbi:MAG TPA: polysaccharide pyruvyl transferase family protein [Polyangiales bacterium]|nr:polysaccharide pyruvyl transferase family protein [Polyangiales bacterium]